MSNMAQGRRKFLKRTPDSSTNPPAEGSGGEQREQPHGRLGRRVGLAPGAHGLGSTIRYWDGVLRFYFVFARAGAKSDPHLIRALSCGPSIGVKLRQPLRSPPPPPGTSFRTPVWNVNLPI